MGKNAGKAKFYLNSEKVAEQKQPSKTFLSPQRSHHHHQTYPREVWVQTECLPLMALCLREPGAGDFSGITTGNL